MQPLFINETVRIWDNGGKTLDRYTAMRARGFYRTDSRRVAGGRLWDSLAFNESPAHGFGQHVEAMPGRHLGKRVKFEDLPEDAQKFVLTLLD